jgi:hypothetical protein
MTVPLSILWRSRLPVRQKLALAGVFGLVVITIAVAIARLGLTVKKGKAMNLPWVVVWTGVEANIGMSQPFSRWNYDNAENSNSYHCCLCGLVQNAVRTASGEAEAGEGYVSNDEEKSRTRSE